MPIKNAKEPHILILGEGVDTHDGVFHEGPPPAHATLHVGELLVPEHLGRLAFLRFLSDVTHVFIFNLL